MLVTQDPKLPCRVCLFDHLVGAGEQIEWKREAERIRGLEVEDQFEHVNSSFAPLNATLEIKFQKTEFYPPNSRCDPLNFGTILLGGNRHLRVS